MKNFLQNTLIAATLLVPTANGCQKPQNNSSIPAPVKTATPPVQEKRKPVKTPVTPVEIDPKNNFSVHPSRPLMPEDKKAVEEIIQQRVQMQRALPRALVILTSRYCDDLTGRYTCETSVTRDDNGNQKFELIGKVELGKIEPDPQVRECLRRVRTPFREALGMKAKGECIVSFDTPRTPKQGQDEDNLDKDRYYMPFSIDCRSGEDN